MLFILITGPKGKGKIQMWSIQHIYLKIIKQNFCQHQSHTRVILGFKPGG